MTAKQFIFAVMKVRLNLRAYTCLFISYKLLPSFGADPSCSRRVVHSLQDCVTARGNIRRDVAVEAEKLS